MDHMGIPVIKLELTNMREAILHAFNERQLAQDLGVRAALEKFCSEGNVQQIIDAAVREHLTRAIKSEVERFYSFGEGRALIKKLVQERLARGETELDT